MPGRKRRRVRLHEHPAYRGVRYIRVKVVRGKAREATVINAEGEKWTFKFDDEGYIVEEKVDKT